MEKNIINIAFDAASSFLLNVLSYFTENEKIKGYKFDFNIINSDHYNIYISFSDDTTFGVIEVKKFQNNEINITYREYFRNNIVFNDILKFSKNSYIEDSEEFNSVISFIQDYLEKIIKYIAENNYTSSSYLELYIYLENKEMLSLLEEVVEENISPMIKDLLIVKINKLKKSIS